MLRAADVCRVDKRMPYREGENAPGKMRTDKKAAERTDRKNR